MEYQNEHSLFDIQYDDNLKQQMKGAANVAAIAAILSLVGSVVSFISFFVTRSRQEAMLRNMGMEGFSSQNAASTGSNLVSAVISLVLAIFMFYFLSQYARLTKAGVDNNDTMQIGDGLAKLATYFKIIGVLLIIVMVFFFLAILIVATIGGR